jgi:hypothetical protein
MLKDTFSLIYDRIEESLLVNLLTDETIEIIVKKVCRPGVGQFHVMTKEILKNLLVICTKKSHFQFNGRFYEQINGVAMGSSLGPLEEQTDFQQCITRSTFTGVYLF